MRRVLHLLHHPAHPWSLALRPRRETRGLKVAEGARELVLTGVHLGKYGWDAGRPGVALLDLLERLLGVEGLARIRLSSILSRHLTPRLIALMAAEPRLCRFFHVPLQAGDDEVLERMNRPYRIRDYLEAIDRVRDAIPDAGIATDVIVGFPGESSAQFERTLQVVERVGYLKIHAFRYSPRPGTPSAGWPDQVPELEKRGRSRELIALGGELRQGFHRDQIGRRREILVEEAFESGELVGHTDNFVKVRLRGPGELVGRLALVQVSESCLESVRGNLIRSVGWEEADPRCA